MFSVGVFSKKRLRTVDYLRLNSPRMRQPEPMESSRHSSPERENNGIADYEQQEVSTPENDIQRQKMDRAEIALRSRFRAPRVTTPPRSPVLIQPVRNDYVGTPQLVPPNPVEESHDCSISTASIPEGVISGAEAVDDEDVMQWSGSSLVISATKSRAVERNALMQLLRREVRIMDKEALRLNQAAPHRRPFVASCFLCAYGNREFDSSDMGCNPIVRIFNIIKTNYGHMSLVELCLLIEDFHYDQLYVPLLDPYTNEPTIPLLSAERVFDHMTSHHLDPYIMLGETLHAVTDAIAVIKNELKDSKTGKSDPKMVAAFMALVDRQVRIVSMPPGKMLFGGGRGEMLTIDPAKTGSVINTKRIEPMLRRDANAIGGATAADTSAVDASHLHDFTQNTRAFESDELPM